MINGTAGGVGSYAVQIAKVLGAEVTAVCSSKNLELVKSLGADRTIDYTQQDFTQESRLYDIVFDTVSKKSFTSCEKILKSQGVYIATLPSLENILPTVWTTLLPRKKAKLILTQARGKDLAYLRELIEAGKIRSVIDRTYLLSELAAAHTHSETERTVGKIAIAVAS